MIDIATLKEYIKALEESSLSCIEISDGTDSIHLEKSYPADHTVALGIQPYITEEDGTMVEGPRVIPTPEAPAAVTTATAPAQNNDKTINAPIVGVFYAAPSPDSDPYVSVGKRVKKGDTVCIIEAMKCMNEIQAEEDGEITAVLATNGELVEFDQPLFSIK